MRFPVIQHRNVIEWEEHPSGVWFVKKLHNERKKAMTGEFVDRFDFEIHEFDPDPVIPPDCFKSESLKE